MQRWQLAAIVMLCLMGAVSLANSARAGWPQHSSPPQPYVVLQSENQGNVYPVTAPAYAWGWFGVCPRPSHVYDGTGYYNHYSQSSIRRGY